MNFSKVLANLAEPEITVVSILLLLGSANLAASPFYVDPSLLLLCMAILAVPEVGVSQTFAKRRVSNVANTVFDAGESNKPFLSRQD